MCVGRDYFNLKDRPAQPHPRLRPEQVIMAAPSSISAAAKSVAAKAIRIRATVGLEPTRGRTEYHTIKLGFSLRPQLRAGAAACRISATGGQRAGGRCGRRVHIRRGSKPRGEKKNVDEDGRAQRRPAPRTGTDG